MNVVGLDLSLTSTGVANTLGSMVVMAKELSGAERLYHLRRKILNALQGGTDVFEIRNGVNHLIDRREVPHLALPDLVAIEGYSYNARNGGERLGELGGVIRLALFELKVPVVEVPPASLKRYATGRGNAKKEDVLASAIRRLDYEGSSHDEADALWLRAMTLDAFDQAPVVMPAAHREALGRVEWPGFSKVAS